jgi:hypothetical protein
VPETNSFAVPKRSSLIAYGADIFNWSRLIVRDRPAYRWSAVVLHKVCQRMTPGEIAQAHQPRQLPTENPPRSVTRSS